jgi:hypothetical protein
MSLVELQAALGHSDLGTTRTYLSTVDIYLAQARRRGTIDDLAQASGQALKSA